MRADLGKRWWRANRDTSATTPEPARALGLSRWESGGRPSAPSFAHQRQLIVLAIPKGRHPQIVVGHPRDDVRLIPESHTACTQCRVRLVDVVDRVVQDRPAPVLADALARRPDDLTPPQLENANEGEPGTAIAGPGCRDRTGPPDRRRARVRRSVRSVVGDLGGSHRSAGTDDMASSRAKELGDWRE
jgi:hypothetical protein